MADRTSVSVQTGMSHRPVPGDTRWPLVAALLWVLVVEHVFSLVTPPYELGVPHLFHFTFGVAYGWLALRSRAAQGWRRVLLTVLLGIQLVGRCVVFVAITETWIRAVLVLGALVTVVVIGLLWRPRADAAAG